MDFRKIRRWETHFDVRRPLAGLPAPQLVVEEVQESAAYRIAPRDLEGSQLSITLSGPAVLRVGAIDHEIPAGSAFLHNHRDPATTYYYRPGGRGAWRFLWIAFNQAEETVAELNCRYGYLFPATELIPILAGFRPGQARSSVEPLTALAGARLVYRLLEKLTATSEEPFFGTPAGRLATAAQSLILANLTRPLDGGGIAAALGVSREHLARSFRTQTGVTLHTYMQRCRLELALNLLAQRNLSCKEIAQRSGFDSYASFARAIRRHSGRSPEEMRG